MVRFIIPARILMKCIEYDDKITKRYLIRNISMYKALRYYIFIARPSIARNLTLKTLLLTGFINTVAYWCIFSLNKTGLSEVV